jgi:hypothetical protein
VLARVKWVIAAAVALTMAGTLASEPRAILAERVTALTRDTPWRLVGTVPMSFRTYHPQGMVKIGDQLIVSSVEVRVPTKRLPAPVEGHDRDAGEGIGHIFKIDMAGHLIAAVTLGEGAMYHPGGLDYDGTHVWVSVAEYRPNSRSIVYRLDPETMTATRMFSFGDHLGALVHDRDNGSLHGVSWGSRRFYRWNLDRSGKITDATMPVATFRTLNRSHYVDYQDCKYAGARRMLCTGVTEIRRSPDAPPFRLGGIDLIDLADGRPLHQVPLLLWTALGLDMTHNATWLEPSATGIRGYFLPEDDTSSLYIYEAEINGGA